MMSGLVESDPNVIAHFKRSIEIRSHNSNNRRKSQSSVISIKRNTVCLILGDNHSTGNPVKTVYNWRKIDFASWYGEFRDISQPLQIRFFSTEIAFK